MVNTKPLHGWQVISKMETGSGKQSCSNKLCNFVGHNQLYLFARNTYNESPLHRFYIKNTLLELNLWLEVIWFICLPLH